MRPTWPCGGYLGSIDLVQRVSWKRAPLQDPLEWALADKRGYRVNSVEDSLWLRILDTAAALEGRHYWQDGSITLRVEDPLGFAGGVFRLDVRGWSGYDDGAGRRRARRTWRLVPRSWPRCTWPMSPPRTLVRGRERWLAVHGGAPARL